MKPLLFLFQFSLALAASTAHAACPQELAVYTEPGSGASLEFRSDAGGSFMASHGFRLVIKDGPVLDGYVIWNNGVSRANGTLVLDCPEGDVTGEELDACTYWDGIVYTVAGDGKVAMIGDGAAAPVILMPDVSRALYYSNLNDGKASLPQFDAFELSGCQE